MRSMHVVAVITSTCHSVTVHLEMICGGAVGRGCSENVAEELRQTNAGDEGKREMMEILQRFHDSGASLSGTEAGGAAPSDLIKDAEESDLEEGAEEGLSQETLSKILAQVILFIPHEILHQRHCCIVAGKIHRESNPICQLQQGNTSAYTSKCHSHISHALAAQIEEGKDLDIQESDLSPAERAAFKRAIANGSLARLVTPWEPWWRSQEAAHLSLSAAGTRIIRDPHISGAGILMGAPLEQPALHVPCPSGRTF